MEYLVLVTAIIWTALTVWSVEVHKRGDTE